MAAQLGYNKLALAMAISVLVHWCAFFALVLLLQFHVELPREMKNLEVSLVPLPLTKAPAKPGKKRLAIPVSPSDKIVPNQIVADAAIELAPAVAGVAFPKVVATPWPGQTSNSRFGARSSGQAMARPDYQQVLQAQRAEQQAQFTMLQLQQLLDKRLDVHPVEAGRCLLAASDGSASPKMICDSPALYAVLGKEEKAVAEMLLALRGVGRMLNGFTVELRAGELAITLSYDEPPDHYNREPAALQ